MDLLLCVLSPSVREGDVQSELKVLMLLTRGFQGYSCDDVLLERNKLRTDNL